MSSFEALEEQQDEAETLIELAEEESDTDLIEEALEILNQLKPNGSRGTTDVVRRSRRVERSVGNQFWGRWNGCVRLGAMLKRMYLQWAGRMGYKTRVLDEQSHEEAGIKSCQIEVSGAYAYGYLKAEIGVHRLVRISPFDANARRHTAFASVDAWPDLDDDIEVDVVESDLRIDTYRASGAGGQHVNTTDSAVRITHLPTNIVVQCQNERSQHKNKARAMKMLKAKLYQHELEKRQEAIDANNAEKKKIEWGSQIRNYVLHPYRMVKDMRTGVEKSATDRVLDGDLIEFMEAWLVQRSGTEQ